ncbi:MAG: class I tRNA ligase family protein, partial [Candidatus Thermoplasmatota archaeon]|nr:class I tRNA ligase family protein [Candidatus Thermoplasmatota archaeon]
TTVFDSLCYKRCLSLGLILDAEGKKMSKSRGNIVDPWDHFNREGADATRWYMVTAGAPWNPLKFDPNGVRETYGKMFLTLWNCYRFHADYAALDGFDPDDSTKLIPVQDRTPLDRWILSRLSNISHSYHQQFEDWNFHKACRDLEEFVVNDLSNWYVRRSRRRLWDENESSDKRACQLTLHEVLTVLCRLMAPVAPYMSDVIHRNLCGGESVHLADWPMLSAESNVGDDILPPIDMMVEAKMEMVRTLAEAGRRIRIEASRRQRLPCQSGWIVGGPDISEFHEILADELNVELLETEKDLDRFQRVELAPNRKALGKKCRQDLPSVLKELDSVDPESFLLEIEAGLGALAGYEIIAEDIEIRRVEKEGFAASTVSIDGPEGPIDVSLVLDLALTENLLSKGLARDIIRRIQSKRKDLDLEVDTTISLEVWLPENAPELSEIDSKHVSSEVRASSSKFHRMKSEDISELDSSLVDVFSLDGEFDISFKIIPS